MYLKINDLIKLSRFSRDKTRGENVKVSPIMLLKTNIEKMSETTQAIISMKTMHIKVARHYVDEKNRGYSKCSKRKAKARDEYRCSDWRARRLPEIVPPSHIPGMVATGLTRGSRLW
jgi:hypothetical protein